MTTLDRAAMEAARAAVIIDPEVNISLVGVQTIIEVYTALAALPAQPVAVSDVMAERDRQKSVEGWTAEHDDQHADGEMALAAACYAAPVPIRCEWPVSDGARSAGEGSAAFPRLPNGSTLGRGTRSGGSPPMLAATSSRPAH